MTECVNERVLTVMEGVRPRGDETTAGRRLVLLPRSDSFLMSGTFGDWERESEVILEDNLNPNRIMAEPYGTARQRACSAVTPAPES